MAGRLSSLSSFSFAFYCIYFFNFIWINDLAQLSYANSPTALLQIRLLGLLVEIFFSMKVTNTLLQNPNVINLFLLYKI